MAGPSAAGMPSGMSIAGWLNYDRMNNHEFTDFTIICEDQHFPVHRAVVGPKSEVLKKAMSGPWKESEKKQLVLPTEDKAYIVSLFVDTIYEDIQNSAQPESFKLLSTWSRLYILGDKYLAPTVLDKAVRMIDRLRQHPLVIDDIIKALDLVFSSTGPTASTLRNQFYSIIKQYKDQLIQEPHFKTLLQPEYNMQGELLTFMLSSNPFDGCRTRTSTSTSKYYLYACPKCQRVIHSTDCINQRGCLSCGRTGMFRVNDMVPHPRHLLAVEKMRLMFQQADD